MSGRGFKVWCPADGDSVEDARTITAFDAKEAAEFWAERDDAESAEYSIVSGRTMPVVVVEAADGTRSQWRVAGEAVPAYSAHALPDTPKKTDR